MQYDVEIINEINGEPEVDVYLVVYQHAKYLKQSIESILAQKTKYKYRIMAFDDCSTDGSRSILLEYQKKYPEKFFLALCNSNSKTQFLRQVVESIELAKYACHLEGDDYWVDPLKIEKQVNFLEKHPEYVGVAGNVMNVNEDGTKQHCDFDMYPFENTHIFTKKHVIQMKMIAHVSTLMYRNFRRNWTKVNFEKYYDCSMNGDQKVSAILGMLGDVYYSHELYTCHRRVFTGTSWTAKTRGKNIAELNIKMWQDLKKYILEEYNVAINIEDCIEMWKKQIGKNVNQVNHVDERTKRNNIIRLFEIWMLSKDNGCSIDKILKNKGIKTVAIYGLAELGKTLYYELYKSMISVEYCIDRNELVKMPYTTVYNLPPKEEKKVDAIIVTAITTFDDIKKELDLAGYKNVIALDEILYEMIPSDSLLKE
ncbi:Glycosyl transferase family 2 [Pseudobutyrivibrio ruminis]|uniref:Glycosyl transferase family 2 n=1 Tax=Pseudobutyrivibrio ruminis TaxID=46206 RepID=A0A1H7KAE5_9FIRM|nr:glycosyltransferase [Pseudobutyrivibrio ruminis]SEK82937.1 Glycosyl transferase family 2 [Pseudobutyrivibrio ruminis]